MGPDLGLGLDNSLIQFKQIEQAKRGYRNWALDLETFKSFRVLVGTLFSLTITGISAFIFSTFVKYCAIKVFVYFFKSVQTFLTTSTRSNTDSSDQPTNKPRAPPNSARKEIKPYSFSSVMLLIMVSVRANSNMVLSSRCLDSSGLFPTSLYSL